MTESSRARGAARLGSARHQATGSCYLGVLSVTASATGEADAVERMRYATFGREVRQPCARNPVLPYHHPLVDLSARAQIGCG